MGIIRTSHAFYRPDQVDAFGQGLEKNVADLRMVLRGIVPVASDDGAPEEGKSKRREEATSGTQENFQRITPPDYHVIR